MGHMTLLQKSALLRLAKDADAMVSDRTVDALRARGYVQRRGKRLHVTDAGRRYVATGEQAPRDTTDRRH